MKILVINSGSSSIKYKLFDMPKEKLISKGLIEHIAEMGSSIQDHYTGLKIILAKINSVSAVGHRVVHGAERFKKPVLIDQAVIQEIRRCCFIAPLHNPANLAGILACKRLLPAVRQVAVFDTAFHQTLPDYACVYGLPYEYYQRFRIRKYGFHGTSHEYVAHEAARVLRRPLNKLKLITCHLGNGCSITAVDRGRSVDTSMGFTPLEGLVMGTRCGDIDPALVTYIMKKKRFNLRQIDGILNKASGLQGISGISNDMRILERKARAGNRRAKLAVDIFVYRIKKYIGAYTAVLGGADAVVFTAGIGENQRKIREKICQGIFSFLKKTPKILVIPTDEELMIARQTYALIAGGYHVKNQKSKIKITNQKSKILNFGLSFCILIFGFWISWAKAQEEEVGGMKKVVMIIAPNGFRDEELLQPKEILERNGIEVKIASTSILEARGMLGAKVNPDMLVNDINIRDFAAIIFIGGTGASQYWDDPIAHKLIEEAANANRVVAAICIAPVSLANAGILKGKRATVWSSEAGQLRAAGANYTARPVERDGNIITASGPTAAGEFAEEILKAIK